MRRAIIIVMDSFGIGGAPDAAQFGDAGANTFAHIALACAQGRGDREGLRQGVLKLPKLEALGLGVAAFGASGEPAPGIRSDIKPSGLAAHACEVSNGKDTPSGHWEIAGVPVPFNWGYFPDTEPTFPADLTQAIIERAGLPGILGNRRASGTVIIDELGEEHIRTGKPICYASADSVFQIAAHENHFGLQRLYDLCLLVRELVDPLNIGRVIARPFVGEGKGSFERTGNRRDYAVPPPEQTLLDRVVAAGGETYAVGKIGDIYAHCGVTHERKAHGHDALFAATLQAMSEAGDGDLVFANFVDFDSLFGHRRDIPGYAAALEHFDRRLPEVLALLREGDLLTLTADHGNDPSWRGSDHTREQVPVLMTGPGIRKGFAGRRDTFADIGETIAEHLGLAPGRHGKSYLKANA